MIQRHQQLLDPATYPDTTQSVEFKETHISRIYLTRTRVYKFKKPLNLGFLDFSSLEKRGHFCREEVRLNQRFAPDTYLGTMELRQDQGKVTFGKRGKLIDYAVQMRRLPEELMLDQMIKVNSPRLPQEMSRLSLALRHAISKAAICRDKPASNLEAVKQNCIENLDQTRAAIGTTLTSEAHDLMEKATRQDLAELKETLLEREARGFVRDGHGDLHAENICMTDPVVIYDCIEFNRRFRVADVLADLAFLVMDLEFRGRRDLASQIVKNYHEYFNDSDLVRLLPFYKGYRAWVRGKVDTMLALDPEATSATRQDAQELARRYFNLALGYLVKPAIFLTSGLMGVGKTTLARALALAIGAVHLRSDIVRKTLAGVPAEQACRDDFEEGIYSKEMTKRTYETLLERIEEFIPTQRNIIIDASFAKKSERDKFMNAKSFADYQVWLLHLDCPEEATLARLDQRTGDVSDGRRELYAYQKSNFDDVQPASNVVVVDTSLPVDYNVQSLLCTVLAGQEQLS